MSKPDSIVLTEEQQRERMRDRTLPYAVISAVLPARDSRKQQYILETLMENLNSRALQAGMVLLSTQTYITSIPADQLDQQASLSVVMFAQWITREAAESIQRQQMLVGGVPPGPRRVS